MSSNIINTSAPASFFTNSVTNASQYTNPYYNIAQQYIPKNIDGQLQWSDHILLRTGFLKAAFLRVINYFINELVIEADDPDTKELYEKLFEKIPWKQHLQESGLNLLACSNECLSVVQGSDRFLHCKKCGNTVPIDTAKKKGHKWTFSNNKYSWKCSNCNSTETEAKDEKSKDAARLTIIHWPMREVFTRHEKVSNRTEYFWEIPKDYKKRLGSKESDFMARVTPREIIEAVFDKQCKGLFQLELANLLHLQLPQPTSIKTDGRAIPEIMFLFDDFYNYQTLKRFNETIMYEDIIPFRIFSMVADNSPMSAPAFNQSGELWKSSVDSMIEAHRRDPGTYFSFPFPVNYQANGGQGKQLAPTELMEMYKNEILGALNIPAELFNMNLQTQVAPVMLRLFENAWSIIPESFNKILQHVADIAQSTYGYKKVKVQMLAVTISDDMERKAIIQSLVQANVISKTELLSGYNLNYIDQVRKKMNEDEEIAKLQQEQQEREQLEEMSEADLLQQQQGAQGQGSQTQPQQGGQPGQDTNYDTSGSNPQDIQEKAQEIAQQLFPQDGSQRKQTLQRIKVTNETLWAAVKAQLDEMTDQAESQGRQSAQQQQGQQNQQSVGQ